MKSTLFDLKSGRFYNEVRVVTDDPDTITCPTQDCFRHNRNYDRTVFGRTVCDNCGAAMKPKKTYSRERKYL